ncbi:hypothetical protein [Simiduia aestuariiviva]|uniref:Uncharacterized protein n=1 Tax=Simiduia aestuariiviva TaxID=1510459 RepID=A0A839UJH5_9GAMM|nr:hypothetical protein [Simiduia aestuariiviva]MBB3167733.1 hypothetical protein [Simiduia aestuariiviva]
MIKVEPPKVSMETSYNACCDSMTCKADKKKYEAVLKELIFQEANYVDFAAKGELYLLKEVSAGVFEDPVVIGELTKSQLIELYDTRMVKRFPGRNVYDRIRVSSGDRCPYCCDIGSVKNLDHYLPKKIILISLFFHLILFHHVVIVIWAVKDQKLPKMRKDK